MQKRLITLLLCLLLVALVACGDETPPENEAWFSSRYSNFDLTEYVTLPDYNTLPLDTAEVERLVNEQVQSVLTSIGSVYHAEGTLATDDTAIIDYVGILEGETEPFEGGSATGDTLVLGSGSFIDGFEEGLIGKTVGETVTLNLTFPADYFENALQSKGVTFTVTIKGFYRAGTPTELTDTLVLDYTRGAYETAEAFLADLREFQSGNVAFEQVREAANIKSYPPDILWGLFHDYYGEFYYAYTQDPADSTYYDINSFEEYLASDLCESRHGAKYESLAALQKASMQEALDYLEMELVLAAVAQTEEFTVDQETYINEANLIAAEYGFTSYEELEEYYTREDIYLGILFESVYEFLGTALA